MEQRVQCPKCRKIYVAYDTISFRCSQCGSPVAIGVAGKTSSKGLPARELQSKLRHGKKSKPILLLLPLLLGLLLHSVGYFSVFLFLVAIVYFFIEIRSKERIQFWKQAVLWSFLFLIGAIVGDGMSPPTAQCADRSFSYSAHHQGTCSWHGGVNEWDPGPWWTRPPNSLAKYLQ